MLLATGSNSFIFSSGNGGVEKDEEGSRSSRGEGVDDSEEALRRYAGSWEEKAGWNRRDRALGSCEIDS